MDWLHEQLQGLKARVTTNEWIDFRTKQEREDRKVARTITADKGGKLLCQDEQRGIDEGMILTDGEWGVTYRFHPKKVPVLLMKKYLVEEAKRKIQALLDEQIVEDEVTRADLRDDIKGSGAFRAIGETHATENLPGGVVAEKMVRGLLSKMAISADLDFDILRADAYDDVRGKVDFIVRRKNTRRGVKVETQEKRTLGIQFTMDAAYTTTIHKEHQLEKARLRNQREHVVDDIVLVTIPLSHVSDVYKKWVKEGRRSGGPDELWDDTTKKQVFEAVLHGIYPEKDIKEQWNNYHRALGRSIDEDQAMEQMAA